MITQLFFAWILLSDAERQKITKDAEVRESAQVSEKAAPPVTANPDPQPETAVVVPLIEEPPLAYVLCADAQCMNGTGWGEAGNEGRSVRFVNDWNPYNRYYLRIFIDGEEAVLTDGLGIFETFARTKNGPRPVSLLEPNGQGLSIVNEGEHRLVVERYLGPAPYQYKDTCVWNQDFDGNLGLNGEYHFWVGACRKIGQASFE